MATHLNVLLVQEKEGIKVALEKVNWIKYFME